MKWTWNGCSLTLIPSLRRLFFKFLVAKECVSCVLFQNLPKGSIQCSHFNQRPAPRAFWNSGRYVMKSFHHDGWIRDANMTSATSPACESDEKNPPKSSAGFPAPWHPFGPNSSFSKMYNFSRIFWGPVGQSLAVFDPIPLGRRWLSRMLYPQSSSWTAACSRGFWGSLSPSWRWKNDRDIRWVQLMTNSPFKMQISTALNRKCWILTGCTLWQTNLATEKRRVQQRHQLPFPGMSQAVQYI